MNVLQVIAAVAVLIVGGTARRKTVDEAGARKALGGAVARLAGMLPESVEGWSGRVVAVDQRGLDKAGVAGLTARRYRRDATGETVTAMLVCGPPGPIAAHGPESCYPGIGFTRTKPALRVHAPDAHAALWSAEFLGGEPSAPRALRVLWTWGEPGAWSAPDNPRLEFASAEILFKLYLLAEPATATATATDNGADPPLALAAALLSASGTASRPTR